jgi:hypothetical protein
MSYSGAAPFDLFFGGVDKQAFLADEYLLADQATLDACLDELENGDCDYSNFDPASCDRALVPRNPRAEGESCGTPDLFLPNHPCGDGLECGGSGSCAVCVPALPLHRLAEGEACTQHEECELGLFCSNNNGLLSCARFPRLGEACEGASRCAEGECLGFVCVPFVGLGEPCDATASCQYDLLCNGTCVPRKRAGDACQRVPSDIYSACHFWCVFDAPDATEGTCGNPDDTSPAPCSGFGVDGMYCPAGSFPDTRGEPLGLGAIPSYCMCLPKLPAGSACSPTPEVLVGDGPCKDGFCSDGLCTLRRPEGSACSAGGECESLVCETTGICTATCPL